MRSSQKSRLIAQAQCVERKVERDGEMRLKRRYGDQVLEGQKKTVRSYKESPVFIEIPEPH